MVFCNVFKINLEDLNLGWQKLRVYQLARELNRDNSEIIRELQHMGVPVTSHSNTVEDRLADTASQEAWLAGSETGRCRGGSGGRTACPRSGSCRTCTRSPG